MYTVSKVFMFSSLDRVNGGSGFLTASFLGCLLVPSWHHLDLLPRKSTNRWEKMLTTNLSGAVYIVFNVDIFLVFLLPTKSCFFCLVPCLTMNFCFTPASNMEGFFGTNRGRASKAQWCKQGWTLNITSKDLFLEPKFPWWREFGEMGKTASLKRTALKPLEKMMMVGIHYF